MQYAETTAISYEVADGVAVLTLKRPAQKNAIDSVMRAELAAAVTSMRSDPGIRALVLTGAGGAFCSGGDIRDMPTSDFTAEAGRDRMRNLHLWFEDLMRLDFPVIAAVDGVAYGAGFSLALVADFVLASPRAQFCLPFLRLGLVPDLGALYTLPRVVGLQRAKELVFSTRVVGAEEARSLGIVMEIQREERLLPRARQLALSFAQASPTAMSLSKHALNTSLNLDLTTMLDVEANAQAIARTTDYHRQAVSNFKQKLPPLFQWPANE